MIKRISVSMDEKSIEKINELAGKHGISRSEEIKFLTKYYLRIQSILKEYTDAFPYLLEDMDEKEIYDLKEKLTEMRDELKTEDEI
jgi:metal-responsive CopG/Arc/MetJ family transcriptional regulator